MPTIEELIKEHIEHEKRKGNDITLVVDIDEINANWIKSKKKPKPKN